MDVSIILATHKRPESLKATLESFCHLEDEGMTWEVIVADNAGGDDARQVVEHYARQLPIKFIVETHLGKCNALNSAMAHAAGDLFLFTDDDIVADSKWVLRMWQGVQARPSHSVFGGRILPKFPDAISPEKLPIDFEHTWVKGCYAIADAETDEGEFHPWMVLGPNWAIRSHLFHQGFAFRTDLGPGTDLIVGDETELAYRLHKSGCAFAYLPQGLVYHTIRPEQLTVQWLYRRVLKSGRSWALNGGYPDVPLLFGVPRYLFKGVVIKYLKYLRSCCQNNQQTRFHRGLQYWFEKGYLYQFWKGLLKENELSHGLRDS